MSAWRVSVGDECIAAACCLSIAPKHFALGDDGRSHPAAALIEADESVLDAVASCPMEAIRVHDAKSGELIDPD
jgi:ferredoxin